MGIFTGAYFEVSDQSARDVLWAKKKDPTIENADVGIPDYVSLQNPLLRPEGSPASPEQEKNTKPSPPPWSSAAFSSSPACPGDPVYLLAQTG